MPGTTRSFYDLQALNRRKTALLIAGFVVLFALVGLGLDYYFLGTDPFVFTGAAIPVPVATLLAAGFAGLSALHGYYMGDGQVLTATRSRPADPRIAEEKQLINVVEEMSIAAGLNPPPPVYVLPDPRLLLASMVGVGIAWASILSMPYAILTGSLPPSKLGYYMGVFNFFIVIPQIVAAPVLGFIVGRFFGGHAINALLVGGASLVIAAALTLRVQDEDDVAAVVGGHPFDPFVTDVLDPTGDCNEPGNRFNAFLMPHVRFSRSLAVFPAVWMKRFLIRSFCWPPRNVPSPLFLPVADASPRQRTLNPVGSAAAAHRIAGYDPGSP